jgi:hypothetical protein
MINFIKKIVALMNEARIAKFNAYKNNFKGS